MTKKLSRTIAALMLVVAIIFAVYALNHPEAGFTWDQLFTFVLYAAYLLVMLVLFIAPFKQKK